MIFDNFRFSIAWRVLLLTFWTCCFAYSFRHAGWVVTPFIFLVAIVLSAAGLVRYVERTNRDFTNFLLAVQQSDFSSQVETDARGKTFTDFRKALNIITTAFHEARNEKEANHIFLRTVVADLNTALLSFDVNGEVKLINDAARHLLHLPYLKNIQSLQHFAPSLSSYLASLKPEGNDLLEIRIDNERLKLAGRAIDFTLQGVPHKLVSIQDIRTEVDATEMDAWEQLLHVLTHEIMNSITPISSLSVTLKKRAEALFGIQDQSEEMADLTEGLAVIARRSEGLIHFVNHYRTLIGLPAPALQLIAAEDIFDRIGLLKSDWLAERGIHLSVKTEEAGLVFKADPEQLEQVLINLINNATDALADSINPTIELTACSSGGRKLIKIADNGKGITPGSADKLFVPFFSTKKNGTGIGLSLSKQIMRRNGGTISLRSSNGWTTCLLEFLS